MRIEKRAYRPFFPPPVLGQELIPTPSSFHLEVLAAGRVEAVALCDPQAASGSPVLVEVAAEQFDPPLKVSEVMLVCLP